MAPRPIPPAAPNVTAIRTHVEHLPHTEDGRIDLDEIRRQVKTSKPITVREDYSLGRKIVVGFAALLALWAVTSGGSTFDAVSNAAPSFLTDAISNLNKANSALANPEKRVRAPGPPSGQPQ